MRFVHSLTLYTVMSLTIHVMSYMTTCHTEVWHVVVLRDKARPDPQRGPGNHYRGALSQPHSICTEIETLKALRLEREETWEGLFPHHQTKGLGERRKLPIAESGVEPRPKMDIMHI